MEYYYIGRSGNLVKTSDEISLIDQDLSSLKDDLEKINETITFKKLSRIVEVTLLYFPEAATIEVRRYRASAKKTGIAVKDVFDSSGIRIGKTGREPGDNYLYWNVPKDFKDFAESVVFERETASEIPQKYMKPYCTKKNIISIELVKKVQRT